MSVIIATIGWVSAFCLAVSAIPQAKKSLKEKNSNGLAGWNLFFWGTGEWLGLIYVFFLNEPQLVLMYLINSICLVIIIYYWFKGKQA